MSYPILDPSHPDPSLASKCALAVMAKAPRSGKVKTRLSPPLTLEQTAALNVCFLRDTTQNIAEVTAAGKASGLISYTPVGDEALFDGLLPKDFSLVLQRGDGFGERLLTSATDILACGFGAVCLIDSDSPTVPAAAFQRAVEALTAPGNRIILGGSNDGGYYLIGMKQPHPELFENITWSTASVYSETISAIAAADIELVELPFWYDVDDAATLKTLCEELLDEIPPPFAVTPGYSAPHSKQFLIALRKSGDVQ
jgi:rSAM/selenodomain-associated transferase 1